MSVIYEIRGNPATTKGTITCPCGGGKVSYTKLTDDGTFYVELECIRRYSGGTDRDGESVDYFHCSDCRQVVAWIHSCDVVY